MNAVSFKNFFRQLNYRHYVCIAITLGCVAFTLFKFTGSFVRITEALRDFGLSVAYYFCTIFDIPYSFTLKVNDFSSMSMPSVIIPETWEVFKVSWGQFWQLWATKENFLAYLSILNNILGRGGKVLVLLLPAMVGVAYFFLRQYSKQKQGEHAEDSVSLRIWKRIVRKTYFPVKCWVLSFVDFVRGHRRYLFLWALIWAFNFNAFTIVFEFIAYYLYFVFSFDVLNLYRQVYKLFADLAPMIMFVPLWAWAIIGLYFFDRFRKRIAYSRLWHMERRNDGFINARSMVLMVCGTMGKGKTTVLTDICLSTEMMFRDKAYELILENDMRFPNFPWIKLEDMLRWAIGTHYVYNLATCKRFIRMLEVRWERFGRAQEKVFDYDYKYYGLWYDDGAKMVYLWDVLETYAQLYLIYVMESSLIVSNYSIRTDMLLSDIGNFPMWNADFFKRDSRLIDSYSRHAHILDWDFMRVRQTLAEDTPYRHALEFGVVAASEIGKERRNALELRNRSVKASDKETNQLNDGFNDGLKMRRQSATVDNYCFLKIVSDEQRPESFGSDARDLFDIINIDNRRDVSLAMPFFALGELVYALLSKWFYGKYVNGRFNRGDYWFSGYFVKNVVGSIVHYYERIYKRFAYNRLDVQLEKGTLDGKYEENRYYLSWKKIYSKRFDTACMSGYWEARAALSPVGLNDIPEYETERATWDELLRQNSYFMNELYAGIATTSEVA